jgi:hypothetical protein
MDWLRAMPVEFEGKQRRGPTEIDANSFSLTKMIFGAFLLLGYINRNEIIAIVFTFK